MCSPNGERLGEEAAGRGLERLRRHLEAHPDDPWLLEEEMTLFVGERPR